MAGEKVTIKRPPLPPVTVGQRGLGSEPVEGSKSSEKIN